MTTQAVADRIQEANERFRSMTAKQRRVAVAEDVLRQVKRRKLKGACGTYLDGYERTEEFRRLERTGKFPECSVCAKGATLISSLRLFDRLDVVGKVGEFWVDFNFGTGGIPGVFTPKQWGLLETAFERDRTFGLRVGLAKKATEAAVEFGSRFHHDTTRLKAIMQNIIDNGGDFRP